MAWGWSRDQIDIVDVDLGLTGTGTEHRIGYQAIVTEIIAGLVGILFVTDFSRAGRRAIDWLQLLELCDQQDVLLAIGGRIYDPKDVSALFMSQLQALLGEHDNRIRRGHLERGRLAKIRAGKTVTQPPVGYVRLPDGSWVKDQDPMVQEGVNAVFRATREGRSLRKAACILIANGARIPARKTGHPVTWTKPTAFGVQRIVTNPSYTGDYVWGRRRSDPRNGRDRRGRARPRIVQQDRVVVVPDHHEPYITRAEWDDIRMMLRGNRWNDRHPGGLGRGGALLQGILYCRIHRGWRMAPVYKTKRQNGTSPHAYHCNGDYLEGGLQCGCRPGGPVDDAVVSAALERLKPVAIETLRAAWRRARVDVVSERRRSDDELRRAEREAEDLCDRYLSVGPENRHLKAELERRYEATKARAAALRESGRRVPSQVEVFTEDAFAEVLTLAGRFHDIWTAPTTSDQDRKEILRALIDRVYVDAFDREQITLTIQWIDGHPETCARVLLPPYAHRLIRQWAADGHSYDEIARLLRQEGIRTKYRTWWSASAVSRALGRMTDRSPRRRSTSM